MTKTVRNIGDEVKTPKGAARKVYEYCQAEAKKNGQNPDNVYLFAPNESMYSYGVWAVCWEEGPFEWASMLSMEQSIYSSELQEHFQGDVILDSNKWFAEPYNSFVLCFCNI